MSAAMNEFARGDMAMMPPLSRPRWRGADHSMARGIAAEYSPPRKMPPTKRRATNAQRVASPPTLWFGIRAIKSVVIAMPAIAILVVLVRP